MDTDLSLIEISVEDDSLLQQMPNDDSCSVYSSSFSPLCSLRPPRPSPRSVGLTTIEDCERPSSSSCRESFDKENINSNKPDMPKLTIEPQQMKRKKKGAGFNLRKSLAWNKAFFTEEGVLDSEELSMISGNLNSLGREKLSIIHEDGMEALLEVSEQSSDSADLLSLEEKLFKDLPTKTTPKSKKIVGSSPQKQKDMAKTNRSVTSSAKKRVLSAQDINRSDSKRSGCPRPTSSSSSPANISTIKAASKELKVLRTPVAKVDSSSANSSAKSSVPGGGLKRTQPTRPVVAEKNVRVRGSSSSTKIVATSATTGPGSKSSNSKFIVSQAKRNVSKATSKFSTSTHMKLASEGLQNQRKPPIPHVPSAHTSDSSKKGVPPTQDYEKLDAHLPNVPIQTSKPSGLRMPSPSIRFFDQQPKASASQNVVNKYIHPSNILHPESSSASNPHSEKKCHDIRPPQGHDRVQQLVSSSPSGISSSSFPDSTIVCTSYEKAVAKVGFYDMRKVEPKPQCGLTDEFSSNKQNIHNILTDIGGLDRECVEPCELGKQLPLDDGDVKPNEDKSLMSTKPCEQLTKDADEKLIDIPLESRDADDATTVDTHAHAGFVLQSADVSMASVEEMNSSLNETISDRAENVDCFSKCKEGIASIAGKSCSLFRSTSKEQLGDDSARSEDGSKQPHVENAENLVHDENITIADPMESDKIVMSSKEAIGKSAEDNEILVCPSMDDVPSATTESPLGSWDSRTLVHLGNGAKLCLRPNNDFNEESSLAENEGRSEGATGTDCENQCAFLSRVTLSSMKVETVHSISLLGLEFEEKNGPEMEDSAELREKDKCRTPVEGKCTYLANGKWDGANDTSVTMEAVRQDPSCISISRNSAAKDESMTVSDLVDQSDDHPDLQNCSIEYDHTLNEKIFLDANSSHESHESFNNVSCEIELKKHAMLLGEEPDPHGGSDVADMADEEHGADDMLTGSLVREDNPSYLDLLEIDASQGMLDEEILEPRGFADGKLSENDHLKSGSLHMDVNFHLTCSSPNIQLQDHSQSISHPSQQSDGTPPDERCKNDLKQKSLVIKPPLYAPPFSDEWLAAIEAAGEEILTKKGGAVQNSPPEKTVPEPGPWSPVKKHNQEIGPFDCTKYTNITTNIPHSSSQ